MLALARASRSLFSSGVKGIQRPARHSTKGRRLSISGRMMTAMSTSTVRSSGFTWGEFWAEAQAFTAELWSGQVSRIFILAGIMENASPARFGVWPTFLEGPEPYYSEAERLYGVAGRGDDDFGPLQKPALGYPGDP